MGRLPPALRFSGGGKRDRERIEVPAFLYAPVRKGQTVGKLTYEINGKVLASVDLLAGEDLPAQIKQKSLWERFLDWFR